MVIITDSPDWVPHVLIAIRLEHRASSIACWEVSITGGCQLEWGLNGKYSQFRALCSRIFRYDNQNQQDSFSIICSVLRFEVLPSNGVESDKRQRYLPQHNGGPWVLVNNTDASDQPLRRWQVSPEFYNLTPKAQILKDFEIASLMRQWTSSFLNYWCIWDFDAILCIET